MSDKVQFFIRDRAEGKTTAAIAWVKEGEARKAYPYWTRIIITPNIDRATWLRKEFNLDYRQVFSIHEWNTARRGLRPVEIAVDDIETILDALFVQGHVKFVTATGEAI